MSDDSRKFQEDLTNAFAALFPLAPRRSLPWAPCHVESFLRRRIKQEIEHGTQAWTNDIVRVLCEAAPLKTHAVDMARIVVEKAKRYERLRVQMGQLLLDHPSSIVGPRMVSVPEELLEGVKYLLGVHPEPDEEP